MEISMKLGYVIFYVPDVQAALTFYEKAFGLRQRFIDQDNYGELDTGMTALGFASEAFAEGNGVSVRPSRPGDLLSPAAEVAFVVDDPQSAFERAVSAGALPVMAASAKPWGQTVAYVRDLNGFVVELCTPVAAE